MKILFQGGFKHNRDIPTNRSLVMSYCKELAKALIENDHQLILTGTWEYDMLIAEEVLELLNKDTKRAKKFITFLLSQRITEIPNIGQVIKIEHSRWWLEERTHQINYSDALIVIGGGKGAVDCVQKAFLARKPVFVAYKIQGGTSYAWEKRPKDYYYIQKGDTEFISDLNMQPQEFFHKVFVVINKLEKELDKQAFSMLHLENLIKDNKLEKVIEVLEQALEGKNEDIRNQLILISSSIKANENNLNLGLLSFEESNVMRTRITNSILNLMSEMKMNGYIG
ncbi:MAG: hypothetical protein SFU99_11010 [Saprospiraceae bacterium]|nr:hypothetical protein [Saprospiraceae bacterium]